MVSDLRIVKHAAAEDYFGHATVGVMRQLSLNSSKRKIKHPSQHAESVNVKKK